MTYIQAPTEYDASHASIFLAGGITGCEHWQPIIAKFLSRLDIVVLDPRREAFDVADPRAAEEQIRWEFRHLARATACLFWFPPETLCPIALYELGKWSAGERPLFLGVHPDYLRRLDVEIQTSLARPEVKIAYSLEELAGEVIAYFKRAECGVRSAE